MREHGDGIAIDVAVVAKHAAGRNVEGCVFVGGIGIGDRGWVIVDRIDGAVDSAGICAAVAVRDHIVERHWAIVVGIGCKGDNAGS